MEIGLDKYFWITYKRYVATFFFYKIYYYCASELKKRVSHTMKNRLNDSYVEIALRERAEKVNIILGKTFMYFIYICFFIVEWGFEAALRERPRDRHSTRGRFCGQCERSHHNICGRRRHSFLTTVGFKTAPFLCAQLFVTRMRIQWWLHHAVTL